MKINFGLFAAGLAFAVGCGGTSNIGDGGSLSNSDAGTAQDAGSSPADAGSAVVYNNCTEAKFVDAQSAANTAISFGVDGLSYSPACVTIGVGKSVTFNGTFANHPLRRGTPASASAGSPNSPIVSTDTGTTLGVTFATAGDYPYFCNFHSSSGMFGVVRVR